jgi:penicillin-binding protein 1A
MLRFFAFVFSLLVILGLAAGGAVFYAFWHYGRGLPDYHQLAHYEPSVTTRVYAGDGRLLAEYASEKRTFVPVSAMPDLVKEAFIAAEDKNFYTHPGIDFVGVARAVLVNLRNRGMGADRRPIGASTITQQVAKNFLLTNEVSIERKIKEAILAFRIERAFSKDHILELYLNEIFLGFRSYGVAAAAMNYFNKSLDELTIAEAAYLAALPKAPNKYNPLRNPDAARERRDYVIARMLEDGYVSAEEARASSADPIIVRSRPDAEVAPDGDYFAEDIRREIVSRFGEKALYEGGLGVRSTMDPRLQTVARRVLRDGLVAYDLRHGYRGPLGRIEPGAAWPQRLAAFPRPAGSDDWDVALVLGVKEQFAEIGLMGGLEGQIPFAEMRWARPWLEHLKMGPVPRRPADVLKTGDVVLVSRLNPGKPGKEYALRQIPKVEGALVAMDPHTGRVLAMVGGFSFQRSQFNRASQAQRQPGSAFKPFIYLSALDQGYTPSSLILDAPIALPQGPGLPLWKPKNYGNDFLGPTTLRVGIEKSRNLMTVRLAAALGMDMVADYTQRFGINDKLPKVLSMALGAGETTPLKLTAGYAMLVNGGKLIRPTLIDRIQDRNGKTILVHDVRVCESCSATFYTQQEMPRLPDIRPQITDPASAYQMVHIMEGVVQRGTGTRAREVGKPLAGKTGTSNDSLDTWFVGFSPDLAVGVFIGFDEPQSLGDKETGGSVAAPVFRDFMIAALKDKSATPFRVPPGVRFVRVNAATGRPAAFGDKTVILEAFKAKEDITSDTQVLDGGVTDPDATQGLEAFGAPGVGIPPSESFGTTGGSPAPEAGGLY